jgi:hypothetical protein
MKEKHRMSRQPAWDKYEVALLVDAYLRIKNEHQMKLLILQELSNTLRTIAINRGIVIDDTYRNLNGMLWQYGFIEKAFQNAMYENRKPPKRFKSISTMYKERRSDFNKLLDDAKKLMMQKSLQANLPDGSTLDSPDITANKPLKNLDCLQSNIEQIVLEFFPNGIQPDSIIDRKKVCRLLVEKFGYQMPDDADYKAILYGLGIAVGKRLYVLSEAQKKSITDTVESLFKVENNVLFYNQLLKIPLFEECHLYDAALIKAVIMSLLPDAICEKHYVLSSKNASVIGDIVNAFGNDIKLNYSEILDRKPYLDVTSVKWELSYSGKFVWTENETYAQERLIKLADEDIRNVETHFLPQVDRDGFATLRQLSLEDSCALNPGVSYYAIRDVMFIRCMMSKYSKNGLIITKSGETRTSIEILSAFCKSLNSSTLDEINAYGQDLLGNQPTTIVSAAIYNMIRVSRTKFVSDDQVSFDVEAIDNALEQFVAEKVIPLSAITSFTAFPDIEDYSWNLFMLDCFLRRFSEKFSIDGGPAQTDIVGGICPKSMRFDSYVDLMAYAVLQDGIELSENNVSDYLANKKYILRRGQITKRVFAAALKLSEQRSASDV